MMADFRPLTITVVGAMLHLQKLSDDELVMQYRCGVARAREVFLTRYRPRLDTFFSTKTAPDDADDLTQRALMVLTNKLDQDDLVCGQIRSLAFGIARKLLLSYFAEKARGRAFDPEVDALADLDPTISRQLSLQRHIRWLKAALQELPLEVQNLLELRYVHDLTYSEIAKIYGVPAGTVASRVRLAKAKLVAMQRG